MARESWDVRGRVAFITGAARGIGWESARRLHGRGMQVALVGLEPDVLDSRARELGERAAAFHADVTDWDQLAAAVDGTVERFGGIDVTIANAGVANVGTILTMEPEDFERVIEVNLLGVWRTVRSTLPHVVERQGYVLPVSSLSAVAHAPLMAPYTATKAGVEAFTDALRVEVAHTGTKVGCAYFGFIDTDMVRRGFDSEAASLAAKRLGPGGPNHSVPVSKAGAAIVRGIERRARYAYAPRWIIAPLLARTIIQPLQEKAMIKRGVADVLEAAAREESTLTTAQPREHHL
jgi:NAD(P)-dependent dehydrogenase (short-subunit alcohol dehydrogenase family)